MKLQHLPLVLIILDGWGYSEETESNPIANANTPFWDSLWNSCTRTLISGSGVDVGLPDEQMGNSEVGHITIGSGRIVRQDFSRVSHDIETGEFFKNKTLCDNIDNAIKNGKSIHIMGLLSDGGVHSHESHIHSMIEMAANRGSDQVYLHAFLDGRDTPPRSAMEYLDKANAVFEKTQCGQIASMIGRYYAMDRDNRWERVEEAYRLLTQGASEYCYDNYQEALDAAYNRDENDEFVKATSIYLDGSRIKTLKNSDSEQHTDSATRVRYDSILAQEHTENIGDNNPDQTRSSSGDNNNADAISIKDGDLVIFMNYRADRAREITHAFIDDKFEGFDRDKLNLENYITLTQYDKQFDTPAVFPPQNIKNSLAQVISDNHLTQLRIAETEKYAHVTFFFNGGSEQVLHGEDRILIPSPKVATYDLQPEMNAPKLTEELVNVIHNGKHDVIICNFANPDMVGHTGNYDATVKAIECIDNCLNKIITAVRDADGEALITADHGNAEKMFNSDTGQAHTAHTNGPVPLVYVGRDAKITKSNGSLADIAPTMLYLIGIDKPNEMSGESLVEIK